jgi:UDP-glucose 4-epimerase
MKVIVFGGAGFVGSHVADALSEAGHEVSIFDLNESAYLRPNQKFIKGDILDLEKVMEAIKGQEIVYNFAGVADIEKASKSPLNTIKTNIIGNANLLEASRLNMIKRFVFASTLYVYSEAGSFYRSSKQACEITIEEYHRKYGLEYTILRYGSLYGLRADESNWIRSILEQALKEGRIVRNGNGEEIREYIHVEDAARCSIDILDDEYKNQNVIIAGHQSLKICDLLIMIKEILGNKIEIEYSPSDQDPLHYEITPYIFKPRLAKRILSNRYIDFGQGIMDCLDDVYKRLKPKIKEGIIKNG